MASQTTNATTSASASRARLVASVRRSLWCNSETRNGELFRYVPKSELPKVSDAGPRALAGSTRTGTPGATSYFQVTPAVPHKLNCAGLLPPRLFYHLLFTASPQALLEVAVSERPRAGQRGPSLATQTAWS